MGTHAKALVTVIDEEFVKVAGLVIALGDALSGSHILDNGRIDWGVAAAAAVGIINAHRAWLSHLSLVSKLVSPPA